MSKKTIGIIGFGDFSRLMIKHLGPLFSVYVSSRSSIAGKDGLHYYEASVEEVLSQDIIIPSMPSQFLEEFFIEHRKSLNENALVVDICSVKIKPVKVLKRVLPKTCGILATHPLFGPTSAAEGLFGQKIMVHPVRMSPADYKKAKAFLASLGLKVIESTPDEHDKIMAYAQGLSHYIGRAMQQMEIPNSELSTKAYQDLLDMKNIQGSDSMELFESILYENPYARTVNKRFKETLSDLDEQLGLE